MILLRIAPHSNTTGTATTGHMAREAAKVVRDQAKAGERAAIDTRKTKRELQKQPCDAEKSIQLPNQSKQRKASRQLQPKITKKRSGGAVRSRVVAQKPP